jgi:hypothetical protein
MDCSMGPVCVRVMRASVGVGAVEGIARGPAPWQREFGLGQRGRFALLHGVDQRSLSTPVAFVRSAQSPHPIAFATSRFPIHPRPAARTSDIQRSGCCMYPTLPDPCVLSPIHTDVVSVHTRLKTIYDSRARTSICRRARALPNHSS